MNLLFVTPETRAAIDGGTVVTGVAFTVAMIDPDKLTASANFYAIEDGGGPGHSRMVTVPVTGATTLSQILGAFKTAIGAQLGVTFQ